MSLLFLVFNETLSQYTAWYLCTCPFLERGLINFTKFAKESMTPYGGELEMATNSLTDLPLRSGLMSLFLESERML